MNKLAEVLKKYDAIVEVEVSEMTDEERTQMEDEMYEAGYKFRRSEPRYDSCIMDVFECRIL